MDVSQMRAGGEPVSEQPPPVPNDGPDLWLVVIDWMQKRRIKGIEQYHTPLQPFNGRDADWDAIEESLDRLVYDAQKLFENRAMKKRVAELEAALRPFADRHRLGWPTQHAVMVPVTVTGSTQIMADAIVNISVKMLPAFERAAELLAPKE
ncbi:hypothetical protein [Fimbriiglobus ruber]|uniref:Uncharacterized protein n=1 Tax=Fimbriiglobus ruber TaxID=1908690 RepID=A0A225CXZ5_9BACT|nr:hypothetical protein [Fimbriiglobus ruber]OWK34240.1 hypothetical protein FRUB_10211 [Fimbriiglobus ruber]